MNLKDRLTNVNPFSAIYEPQYGATYSGHSGYFPKCEIGYMRAYYQGKRLWNSCFPLTNEYNTPELIREFDEVYEAFHESFPTFEEFRDYCWSHAEPTASTFEYNLYLVGEFGSYWLRCIMLKGEYNLYIHCYSNAAMKDMFEEESVK